MRWMSKAALACAVTGFVASPFAKADPFDAKFVPADAKWVIHVDLDAARDTRSWSILKSHLEQNPDYMGKVAEVETITGMHFPQDMHDVTVYGRSAEEEAGVVIVHAKIDKEKTLAALQSNPSYGSQTFGDYQVMTWDDNEKKMFGAFHDENTVILGRSEENIEAALKTIDGKSPSIEPDSALAAGGKPQLLAYVAAKDLPDLKKSAQPRSPLMAELDSAWISLSEKGDDAELQASVTAKSADAAEQMRTVLDGIKAMVTLNVNSDNPDPNAKNVATALTRLKATTEDAVVKIDFPVSLDLIAQTLDQAGHHAHPTTGPSAPAAGQ